MLQPGEVDTWLIKHQQTGVKTQRLIEVIDSEIKDLYKYVGGEHSTAVSILAIRSIQLLQDYRFVLDVEQSEDSK